MSCPISLKYRKMSVSSDQNGVIQPLLTDLYQITMAYAYWKNEKFDDYAVFDLFFRKNPFHGEFTIFAGLEECIKFVRDFEYSVSDIEYLKKILPPTTDERFFVYLRDLRTDNITIHALDEGSIAFPRVPLLRIEGPLPVVQLLETTLLNLVNFASLVATNAARFRLAAGDKATLLEFGLRRAQGPDGGLSASKYCYIGGFDGTSNVLAGKLYGIPVKGTHAHAFVNSFQGLRDLKTTTLIVKNSSERREFVAECSTNQKRVCEVLGVLHSECNEGELAAFAAYAMSFPDGFLGLVDTYNVVRSGLPNFLAVCLTLLSFGYRPVGIRLDSGDLAYLSVVARRSFHLVADRFNIASLKHLIIVVSNDINENTIHSLNQQKVTLEDGSLHVHSINSFGIGTHLVTCQQQPALGCVFKLVELNGIPRMKLSEDINKVTIPGSKDVYRLFGQDGTALLDLMQMPDEPAPVINERVLCRHPFEESKRAFVRPTRVCKLYATHTNKQPRSLPTIEEIRDNSRNALKFIRNDHKRALNPTPYKVSVSNKLYQFIHKLWLQNAPIGELS